MPSTIYVGDRHCIRGGALAQTKRPETISFYSELADHERQAIEFAWQWLQGNDSFVQPTSGSTGAAKTIVVERRRMIASAELTIDALGLTSDDTALLCLHPKYIGGKMMIVRSLLAGMDLVLTQPSPDPLQGLPFLPGFAAMVPLQIQRLLEEKRANELNRMKVIILGGAPVSVSLETKIVNQLTLPVYSTYGMTETVSHIALRKLTHPQVSAFYQLLGDNQIRTDSRGCLQVKGAVTGQQWLTTNDLVEMSDDRRFRWLGRHDFVINSGGVKISPESVETALEPILVASGFTGRFLVVSLPDERLGERLVLLLEGPHQLDILEKEVLDKAKTILPPYHAPKEIYYLPEFIETPTGKIRRKAIQKLLVDQHETR